MCNSILSEMLDSYYRRSSYNIVSLMKLATERPRLNTIKITTKALQRRLEKVRSKQAVN